MVASNETILHTMLDSAAAAGAKRSPKDTEIGRLLRFLHPSSDRPDGLQAFATGALADCRSRSKDERTELLAHYQLINVTAFSNFGEQQDFKDSRKQIAIGGQGAWGSLSADFYFRTGEVAEKPAPYVQHITNMLKLMGDPAIAAADCERRSWHWRSALAKVSDGHHLPTRSQEYLPLDPVIAAGGFGARDCLDRFLKATGHSTRLELNVHQSGLFKA